MTTFESKFDHLINQIDIAVMRISKSIFATEFKKNSNSTSNISERQFHILYMIEKRNINTTSALAKFFNLSKPNISLIVSKLETMNCLSKIYNSEDVDGRSVVLEVTKTGNEYLNIHINKMQENYILYFSNFMTEEIQKEFFDIITLLCNLTNIEVNKENIYETILLLTIFINIYFENTSSKLVKDLNLKISKNDCHLLYMISNGINTLDELSNTTSISNSTLSIQLKSLLKKELLTQLKEDDKRKKSFYITKTGETLIKTVLDYRTNLILQDIKVLNDDQRENVIISCEKILTILNIWLNK